MLKKYINDAQAFSSCPTIYDAAFGLGYAPKVLNGLRCNKGSGLVFGVASTLHAIERNQRVTHSKTEKIKLLEKIVSGISDDSVLLWQVESKKPRSSFGGILSGIIKAKGARAVIIDGFHRDSSVVANYDMPVWARGCVPTSGSGWFDFDIGNPVTVCDELIEDKDFIFADDSGIVVLSSSVDLDVLRTKCEEIEIKENKVLQSCISNTSAEDILKLITHI